jgi:hypothetical protein
MAESTSRLVRSDLFQRRQKRPLFRQQFLKRLMEPHGHRSLSPRRSTSSISPPLIVRRPRFTWVSEGKLLRRLLVGSKGERRLWVYVLARHDASFGLWVTNSTTIARVLI